MKRFCIKFCLLFLLIDGFIGLYIFGIQPNLSGDMGQIGQIPFGQEYNKRVDATYSHERKMVQDIFPQDTITSKLITIGDSFSRQGGNGYSQFLAELMHCDIQNVRRKSTPEQTFVQLLYHHRIPTKTTVILEVIERYLIWRMNSINFKDTTVAYYLEEVETPENKPKQQRHLEDALLFLKKSVGIKQPISCYPTSENLFSHSKRHNKLYIYDSPWDNDGDLRFTELAEKDILNAYKNMEALHSLAESHGIHLIVLIAADKYDVYEPFITTEHTENHVLDYCPDAPWIINTKPILQSDAHAGVKDIYYINDTHWSPTGAKIVAEEILRRLHLPN